METEDLTTPVRRTARARKVNPRFVGDDIDENYMKLVGRITASNYSKENQSKDDACSDSLEENKIDGETISNDDLENQTPCLSKNSSGQNIIMVPSNKVNCNSDQKNITLKTVSLKSIKKSKKLEDGIVSSKGKNDGESKPSIIVRYRSSTESEASEDSVDSVERKRRLADTLENPTKKLKLNSQENSVDRMSNSNLTPKSDFAVPSSVALQVMSQDRASSLNSSPEPNTSSGGVGGSPFNNVLKKAFVSFSSKLEQNQPKIVLSSESKLNLTGKKLKIVSLKPITTEMKPTLNLGKNRNVVLGKGGPVELKIVKKDIIPMSGSRLPCIPNKVQPESNIKSVKSSSIANDLPASTNWFSSDGEDDIPLNKLIEKKSITAKKKKKVKDTKENAKKIKKNNKLIKYKLNKMATKDQDDLPLKLLIKKSKKAAKGLSSKLQNSLKKAQNISKAKRLSKSMSKGLTPDSQKGKIKTVGLNKKKKLKPKSTENSEDGSSTKLMLAPSEKSDGKIKKVKKIKTRNLNPKMLSLKKKETMMKRNLKEGRKPNKLRFKFPQKKKVRKDVPLGNETTNIVISVSGIEGDYACLAIDKDHITNKSDTCPAPSKDSSEPSPVQKSKKKGSENYCPSKKYTFDSGLVLEEDTKPVKIKTQTPVHTVDSKISKKVKEITKSFHMPSQNENAEEKFFGDLQRKAELENKGKAIKVEEKPGFSSSPTSSITSYSNSPTSGKSGYSDSPTRGSLNTNPVKEKKFKHMNSSCGEWTDDGVVVIDAKPELGKISKIQNKEEPSHNEHKKNKNKKKNKESIKKEKHSDRKSKSHKEDKKHKHSNKSDEKRENNIKQEERPIKKEKNDLKEVHIPRPLEKDVSKSSSSHKRTEKESKSDILPKKLERESSKEKNSAANKVKKKENFEEALLNIPMPKLSKHKSDSSKSAERRKDQEDTPKKSSKEKRSDSRDYKQEIIKDGTKDVRESFKPNKETPSTPVKEVRMDVVSKNIKKEEKSRHKEDKSYTPKSEEKRKSYDHKEGINKDLTTSFNDKYKHKTEEKERSRHSSSHKKHKKDHHSESHHRRKHSSSEDRKSREHSRKDDGSKSSLKKDELRAVVKDEDRKDIIINRMIEGKKNGESIKQESLPRPPNQEKIKQKPPPLVLPVSTKSEVKPELVIDEEYLVNSNRVEMKEEMNLGFDVDNVTMDAAKSPSTPSHHVKMESTPERTMTTTQVPKSPGRAIDMCKEETNTDLAKDINTEINKKNKDSKTVLTNSLSVLRNSTEIESTSKHSSFSSTTDDKKNITFEDLAMEGKDPLKISDRDVYNNRNEEVSDLGILDELQKLEQEGALRKRGQDSFSVDKTPDLKHDLSEVSDVVPTKREPDLGAEVPVLEAAAIPIKRTGSMDVPTKVELVSGNDVPTILELISRKDEPTTRDPASVGEIPTKKEPVPMGDDTPKREPASEDEIATRTKSASGSEVSLKHEPSSEVEAHTRKKSASGSEVPLKKEPHSGSEVPPRFGSSEDDIRDAEQDNVMKEEIQIEHVVKSLKRTSSYEEKNSHTSEDVEKETEDEKEMEEDVEEQMSVSVKSALHNEISEGYECTKPSQDVKMELVSAESDFVQRVKGSPQKVVKISTEEKGHKDDHDSKVIADQFPDPFIMPIPLDLIPLPEETIPKVDKNPTASSPPVQNTTYSTTFVLSPTRKDFPLKLSDSEDSDDKMECSSSEKENIAPTSEDDSSPPSTPEPKEEEVKVVKELTPEEKEERDRRNKQIVEERMKMYEHLEENLYLSERVKSKRSKEAKRMVCDCTLTKEELMNNEMGCGDDCINRLLMIECGSRCPLKEHCLNKSFQQRKYSQVEVFNAEEKGCGVRACQDIPVGSFIMEYIGEVFDTREFKRRRREYAKGSSAHFYFMALRSDRLIDATRKGNISRFINHSCNPNAETQKWTVNGDVRIGFFATETISAGEEINFDYRLERYGREPQKCYCGTPQCRGWLGEPPDQKTKEEKEEDRRREMKDRQRREGKRSFFEDMDLEDEIEKLRARGLRNRQDTLTLSRLMVRCEDAESRLALLKILATGEEASKRLFLDYHGLKLLWSWMVDISGSHKCNRLKIEILRTLSSLPITNRTQVTDSKILSVVERWSKVDAKEGDGDPKGAPDKGGETLAPPPAAPITQDKKTSDGSEDSEDAEAPDGVKDPPGAAPSAVSPAEDSSSQEDSNEVPAPTAEGEGESPPEPEEVGEEGAPPEEDEEEVRGLAGRLLGSWLALKEAFRIPKKERMELMKEHERAVDKEYAEFLHQERSADDGDRTQAFYDRWRYSSSDRERQRERERDRERRRDKWRSRRREEDDDKGGLSKEERRERFAMQVAKEDEEARRRKLQEEMWSLHLDRCALLGHDPYHTPIFDPSGRYYWDPSSTAWQPYVGPSGNLPVPASYGMTPGGTMENVCLTGPPVTQMFVPGAFFPLPNNASAPEAEAQPDDTPEGDPVLNLDLASIPLPGESISDTPAAGSPTKSKPPLPGDPADAAERVNGMDTPPLAPPGPVTIHLPPRWKMARDGGRLIYFYHTRTRHTQWELPEEGQHLTLMTQYGIDSDSESDLESDSDSTSSSDSEDFSSDEEEEEEEVAEEPSVQTAESVDEKMIRRPKGKKVRSEKLVQERVISPILFEDREAARRERKEAKERAREEARKERWQLLRALKGGSGGGGAPAPSSKAGAEEGPGLLGGISEETVASPDNDEEDEHLEEQLTRFSRKQKTEGKGSHTKAKSKERAATAMADTSDLARKIKDNFRSRMATYIVSVLNPYRKPDCAEGRITSNEDFKYLARKLTHFVMVKELKQLPSVDGLDCSESVRHKTKEFVRKYMSKYGGTFKRDPNDTKEY